MSTESLNADRIFREKNILLFNPAEVKQVESSTSTQMISKQRAAAYASALNVARLCAKASSLRFGNLGQTGLLPMPGQ